MSPIFYPTLFLFLTHGVDHWHFAGRSACTADPNEVSKEKEKSRIKGGGHAAARSRLLPIAILTLISFFATGCASADREFRQRVESVEGYAKGSTDGEQTRAVIGGKITFRKP